jgi:hypothetical protein
MRVPFKSTLLAGALLAVLPLTAPAAELLLPAVESCGQYIQTTMGGLDTNGDGVADNLQCLAGTVTGNDATTSGTYIASYHDEFLSYSIEALEVIQRESNLLPEATYGEWDKLVSGSGTLDIGVLIKASGQGVLNNPDPFPDAASSNTSDQIYVRTWGGDGGVDTNDPGADPNDPVLTVAEVVDWLAPESIPVFYFDLADPQNDPVADMYFSGQIYVTDASGTTVLDVWALDNQFDGAYQADVLVLAPKNVPVYIPGSGCDDGFGIDWCVISNSRGSGSPEFVAYAPDMNLSPYAVDGNLFWGNFKISSTSAADEEIYLTKRIGTTQVPEPGVLGLLGLGLLGLGLARRRA